MQINIRVTRNSYFANPFLPRIFTSKYGTMLEIDKKYIVDKNKKAVAVQIDIDTFNKIEQVLEDYALSQLILENSPNEILSLSEAKSFYNKLPKKQ